MKHIAMALIRFYRRYLSRLKPAPTCRFTPTCSAYALEAFEKRGFLAGLTLTLWRLLRCSPLSPAGYDPVPRAGFKTMPMRWSRYDKYRAEQEASAESSQEESDGMISPDPSSNAFEDDPSEDES
ncbi:MAG: membrane protein insertion efficiency factor YidD [Clostridia bacterium]|nr:membrane protein insertion efficiency factor YidD [Clostridia bacterium]